MKKLINKYKELPIAISLPLTIMFIGTIIPIIFSDTENFLIYLLISSYVMVLAMLVIFLGQYLEKSDKSLTTSLMKKRLTINLDGKTVYLVDYENTNHLPTEIKTTDENTIYYVFCNAQQRKKLAEEIRLTSTKSRIETFVSEYVGKNYLDIGIGMYVGAIYSLYIPKEVFTYSNDQGYQSLVRISEDLGYFNLKNISPKENINISNSKIDSIYKKVLDNTTEKEISLGTFKKKIKKSSLNINSDEVIYIIGNLKERNKIIIKDSNGHQKVELKRK